MNNFFVVTNAVKDSNGEFTNKIISFLEEHGGKCTGNEMNYNLSSTMVPEETQYIIVIGGDGTFIHTAKDLIDLDLPILGVNLGTLGYLTEIDSVNYEKDLIHIVSGDFHIENRMLLNGQIFRDGEVICSDIALNDIVLNRSQTMGIIDSLERIVS